jgi:hypothetical protein
MPASVVRVDPVSGQRQWVMAMAPPDRAGLTSVVPFQWIDDGKGYVYSYFRELSKLFVVSGVTRQRFMTSRRSGRVSFSLESVRQPNARFRQPVHRRGGAT